MTAAERSPARTADPAGCRCRTDARRSPLALPVAKKVRLLTGADSWRTHGCEAIGLRPMVTSDGPAGVRGTTKDERSPSASLPCPSALGATWDTDLVGRLAPRSALRPGARASTSCWRRP